MFDDIDQNSVALWLSAICVVAGVVLAVASVFPFSGALKNPMEVSASLITTGTTLGFGVKGKNER